MNKHFLTLIFILAALVAVGFLPGSDAVAQAIGLDETFLEEPGNTPQADSAAFSASPVMQIVVGLTGTLFGILTFLPLLWKEDRRCGDVD